MPCWRVTLLFMSLVHGFRPTAPHPELCTWSWADHRWRICHIPGDWLFSKFTILPKTFFYYVQQELKGFDCQFNYQASFTLSQSPVSIVNARCNRNRIYVPKYYDFDGTFPQIQQERRTKQQSQDFLWIYLSSPLRDTIVWSGFIKKSRILSPLLMVLVLFAYFLQKCIMFSIRSL